MFGLRKKKPVGNVLKLFKIITPEELGLYNSKTINNVVELSVNMFYDEDVFNCIELNYGCKTYKKLTTFLDKLKGSLDNIEIVSLVISNSMDTKIISYSNEILNQIQKDDFGIVELIICSDDNKLNNETVRAFVEKLNKIFPIDYGYIFPFEKGIDIFIEKKVKKSFFTSSVSVTKEDILNRKRLLNINNGYIPKIYPTNIFNQSQFDCFKNDRYSIEEVIEINNILKMVVIV